MSGTMRVTLAIPDAARFDAVLGEAAALGFKAERVMRRLGVAVGTLPADALAQLRALDGVGSADPERTLYSSS